MSKGKHIDIDRMTWLMFQRLQMALAVNGALELTPSTELFVPVLPSVSPVSLCISLKPACNQPCYSATTLYPSVTTL